MPIALVKVTTEKQEVFIYKRRWLFYLLFFLFLGITTGVINLYIPVNPPYIFLIWVIFLIAYEIFIFLKSSYKKTFYCGLCKKKQEQLDQPCPQCGAIAIKDKAFIKQVRDIYEWKKYNQILSVSFIISLLIVCIVTGNLIYKQLPKTYPDNTPITDNILLLVIEKHKKEPFVMQWETYLNNKLKKGLSLYRSSRNEEKTSDFSGKLYWESSIKKDGSMLYKVEHQPIYPMPPVKIEVHYQLINDKVFVLYYDRDVFNNLPGGIQAIVMIVFYISIVFCFSFFPLFFILFITYRFFRYIKQ